MDAIYAKSLPPRPSLEQYKKQAKDLLKACRAGEPDALRRITDQWPTFDGATAELAGSNCTLAAAQLTIAREYGFKSWPRFSKHLRGLAHGSVRQYEAAVEAIVTGDLTTLGSLLDSNPGLVRERSTRTHGATLLHYVAANGVENYRQKTPSNAVEIADLLLRRGSEADALAFMYGGDATTMSLLVSSAHPAEAGLQGALADKLIDFGAAPNGPKNDSDPLLTALIFDYPETAERLVRRGARIDNVVVAAGMGREDLVRSFVDDDGGLRPDAPVVRSHAQWMPSTPRANVEWAFVLATWMGHATVVEFLSRRVDLNALGPHGFTALHCAVLEGHVTLVDLLLERGAPLEARDRNHNSTVLGCAVWAVQNAGDDDFLPIVERLVAAGADTDVITLPTGNPALDELLR